MLRTTSHARSYKNRIERARAHTPNRVPRNRFLPGSMPADRTSAGITLRAEALCSSCSTSYYSLSLSFSEEARELCESLSSIIARQRGPLGCETSIWPCLTASGRQILIFYNVTRTCPPVDLRIRDVECPELLAELCLIPEVCSLTI